MGQKEQPGFFNCQCRDGHFAIEITRQMRSQAKQLQNTTNEVDTTDSRSSNRSQKDSFIGKLAEVAVQHFFKNNQVRASFNAGWRYDMTIGRKTAEVKARDYTQTSSRYCDLLVRDREDTDWSPSDVDIVIQVMVNGKNSKKAYITGFTTGNHAAKCGFFNKAKTHRTRKVPHSKLRPIEDLL